VFVARQQTSSSGTGSSRAGLWLIRAQRQFFAGPAGFLRDPLLRADVGAYLADMVRPYARTVPAGLFGEPLSAALGQSYGEMGLALLGSVVTAAEPVDLLVLAFSVHDLWPGRATAAYLSRHCPGTPMSFAVCDQGPAAAFTGLRIAREYAVSAGCRRVLLIVVEQAALPYDCAAPVPSRHCGVAMLYGDSAVLDGDCAVLDGDSAVPGRDVAVPPARLAGLRQYPGTAPADVAALAGRTLAELSAGHRGVRLVLCAALAAVWPGHPAGRARVASSGQPFTGVWWELAGELASADDTTAVGGADLLVAADYDADLGYLCLAAIEPG
jgi:4-hydroxymandelate oxidase